MWREKFKYFILLFALVGLWFLESCSDEEPEPPVKPITLVSYDEVFSRTKEEIEILIGIAGVEELNKYMEYDITVYTVTYRTKYLEEEIIASGLIVFPDFTGEIPMLSFQHGTITRHLDAPTSDLNFYGILSSFSSAGYIFCIPDLLGFGSSTDILHPYYHYESTADPVVDILKAAKELSEVLNYKFDGNVFLAGYSEGGYATMAGHKMMEETSPTGLNLLASAPASGGYYLKGMQEYFFSQENYQQPYYLGYVAMSYRQVYEVSSILTDIFKEPYSTEMPDLFDGTLTGGQINENLTNVMADLLQPDILTNIDTDPKYKYLNDAFAINSLHEFVPKKQMTMYHGTADITVPFQNSLDTYNSMIQLGASPDILSLIPLQDDTHESGIFPYIIHVIETFDALK
jgi:pimeloyl-ACP methyl ester carboxylesterase